MHGSKLQNAAGKPRCGYTGSAKGWRSPDAGGIEGWIQRLNRRRKVRRLRGGEADAERGQHTSSRRTAGQVALAELAGLGHGVGIVAAIACIGHCMSSHCTILAMIHRTGLLKDVRARDPLKGNDKAKQNGDERTHWLILA